jgi:hypothetical protein
MSSDRDKSTQVISEFVRGERSWKSLESVGIFIEPEERKCQVDNPWSLVARITPADVALGLLRLSGDTTVLQTWAWIILAGSAFLDLAEEFETDAFGALLLDALWDASFGLPPSQASVEAALELMKRTQVGWEA